LEAQVYNLTTALKSHDQAFIKEQLRFNLTNINFSDTVEQKQFI
jgi:hypothetical protein